MPNQKDLLRESPLLQSEENKCSLTLFERVLRCAAFGHATPTGWSADTR